MKYPKVNIINTIENAKEVVDINMNKLVDVKGSMLVELESGILEKRSTGNLAGKGVYLGSRYDWVIVKDDQGELVLVPFRK
jgi:hypothetical protein